MSNSIRCSKDKGDRLEEEVIRQFNTFDSLAGKAPKKDGDVVSQEFLVECKNYNTSSISLDYLHWLKISRKASHLLRIPIYVRENKHEEIFATMSFEHLVELLKELYKLRGMFSNG